jgi:hypothetical protein
MSSFFFCSSCVRSRERRFYCDSIHFIELDFALFCTLLRLFSLSEIQRWIVSLCDFLYVLFRSRSAIFHSSAVVSIIAEPLSHTTSFQYFAARDCEDWANWLIWFVMRSSTAVDDVKSDCLTTKWSIFERIFFRDSSILSYEFIYFYILIFRIKSFNSSIHRWKLFEMKINIMLLKKILSSFIVEEKNSKFTK